MHNKILNLFFTTHIHEKLKPVSIIFSQAAVSYFPRRKENKLKPGVVIK